jgi:hypothetical protein
MPAGLRRPACWLCFQLRPWLTAVLPRCAGVQVLWDVATGEAICGSPTHSDFVLSCRFFNNQSDKLITAGNYNLQASCACMCSTQLISAQASQRKDLGSRRRPAA